MFRFTIRELLLLTAIVALGLVWWMDRTRAAAKASEQERRWQKWVDGAIGEIRVKTGASVEYTDPSGRTGHFWGDETRWGNDIPLLKLSGE